MKNYALNDEDKKNFICNLRYTDTSIIACMADGSEEEHPNNREELISLLERMKQQVLDADVYLNRQKSNLKESVKKLVSVLLCIAAIIIINSPFYNYPINVCVYFVCFLSLLDKVFKCLDYILDSKKNIDDVKKHRLYIENMDALSNCLTHNFSKVSDKTKELVKSGLDINKVDQISKKEMEFIVGDRP